MDVEMPNDEIEEKPKRKSEKAQERGFMARIKRMNPELYQMIQDIARKNNITPLEALIGLAQEGIRHARGYGRYSGIEQDIMLIAQNANNPVVLAKAITLGLRFWDIALQDYTKLIQTQQLTLSALQQLDQLVSQKVNEQLLSLMSSTTEEGKKPIQTVIIEQQAKNKFLDVLSKGLDLAKMFIEGKEKGKISELAKAISEMKEASEGVSEE